MNKLFAKSFVAMNILFLRSLCGFLQKKKTLNRFNCFYDLNNRVYLHLEYAQMADDALQRHLYNDTIQTAHT